MYDLPEHLKFPLTKDNEGPAFDEDFDHWGCWCGDPECHEWEGAPPEPEEAAP